MVSLRQARIDMSILFTTFTWFNNYNISFLIKSTCIIFNRQIIECSCSIFINICRPKYLIVICILKLWHLDITFGWLLYYFLIDLRYVTKIPVIKNKLPTKNCFTEDILIIWYTKVEFAIEQNRTEHSVKNRGSVDC